MSKFCSSCGTALNEGARFCHSCGSTVGTATASAATSVGGKSRALAWTAAMLAIVVVTALVTIQFSSSGQPQADATGLGPSMGRAPDLSTMSPEEQASRLFDRVMRLAGDGQADSAAFFAPMAFGAIEAAGPVDSHRRYDMGMVALVTGNTTMAKAKADTILASRPSHLLGLLLAARAADATKSGAAATALWKRLVAAEVSERAAGLPEYTLHANDIDEALRTARGR